MSVTGRVYVAGHTGLVGSACVRRWSGRRGVTLLTAARQQLDLTDAAAVSSWLAAQRPDVVVLAAGRVGGIAINAQRPAEFLHENLMIEANLIDGAWYAGVRRLINFGSACMYPKDAPQPMSPEQLWRGPMEPTSQPYAVAKLAGLTMVEAYNRQYGTAFETVIPCTLYGPGDNFDPAGSHVAAALIRKLHDARQARAPRVALWGSGRARRELLYVEDLVDALETLLARAPTQTPINIGPGASVEIREVAAVIAEIVGFAGRIDWDTSRPDGALDKRLDSRAIGTMGWSPKTPLREGLQRTYEWFLAHHAEASDAQGSGLRAHGHETSGRLAASIPRSPSPEPRADRGFGTDTPEAACASS